MASVNQTIEVPLPLGGQRRDLSRVLVPQEAAFELLNFLFRGDKFRVRPGYAKFGTTLGDYANGMISYDHHSGTKFLVAATNSKWWKFNPASMDWVDITESGNGLSASENDPQVFRNFWKNAKTYLIGVNGHNDNPVCWDGAAANYSDVGGSPPKAKAMAVLSNRLVLANLPGAPYQIDVSAFNDFESGWGTTQVINLMQTPGDIIAIEEMSNLQAVVYKTDAILLMVAQASIAPFAFELKKAGIDGPASSRAIARTPLGHFYLSNRGDIFLFDGFTLSPMPPAVTAHLNNTLDNVSTKLKKAFAMYNSFYREVWFLYCSPASNYPDQGLVLRLTDQTVWPVYFGSFQPTTGLPSDVQYGVDIGSLAGTIGGLSGVIGGYGSVSPALIMSSASGQCYNEGGFVDDSAKIPFIAETGLLNFNKRGYTTVQEADHIFVTTPSGQIVEVQLGKSVGGEDPGYGTERTIDIAAAGPHVTSFEESSRFFSLRLHGYADQEIEWRGSMVTGVARGLR